MADANLNVLVLKNVRLSYPHLFEPTDFKGDKKFKYRAVFLLPKTDVAQCKALQEMMLQVGTGIWGKDAARTLKSIENNANKCFVRDGDLTNNAAAAGCLMIGSTRKIEDGKPRLVDRNNREVGPADGLLKAGFYVNGKIDIFASNNTGAGIYGGLRGVQYVKDGEALGGGAPVREDEFGDLGDLGEGQDPFAD